MERNSTELHRLQERRSGNDGVYGEFAKVDLQSCDERLLPNGIVSVPM
jgi:hypothetical protein